LGLWIGSGHSRLPCRTHPGGEAQAAAAWDLLATGHKPQAAQVSWCLVPMRYLDWAIIVVYLAGITWFGARFRRRQKSLKDYFLGGRTAPWWAIALSIVSAETSTLTIISTPGLAFGGDLGFLQVVLGYLVARIVISLLFLPHYFRGEMYTAYELIEIRFGPRLRRVTAATFLVVRALAEGVRVFAISLVISIILGTGEVVSIVLIVCLTLFYTFEGGMTAVIWTDVVQMILYVVGAVVSFVVILHQIPGGWAHVAAVAAPLGKLRVFDLSFHLTPAYFSLRYTFWAGLIGGCFLTTASHGTEQLMVQRLLAARNEGQSRAALFASWIVIFVQFSLFLLIGLMLFVAHSDLHLPAPDRLDRLYPEFVWHSLPHGLAGLVIASILAAAMSNLSAALNALASTTVIDFWRPLGRKLGRTGEMGMPRGASEMGAERGATEMRMARGATIAWGAVLLVIGAFARRWGGVLEAGLTIASIGYGGLLGVFLVGLLPRRIPQNAAILGMVAGVATEVYFKLGTSVAWTWFAAVGTVVTFVSALLVAPLMEGDRSVRG
jgi:SSS family transporter